MRCFFGGAEIGSHRKILEQAHATNVAMSYIGASRRVKNPPSWKIEDKFPPLMSVFLDSGAYTVNANETLTEADLEETYEHYQEFVLNNLDRVDMVSEFDALALGMDWIEEERDTFWSQVPREKFMAVWHPVWGVSYLHEMASRYEIIGIPSTSLEGRELRPVLNALAAKGTRLHGVAMTKIEEMQSIRWDSVASTSWITPQRFGDTIVWTGKELKRYPKKMKEIARKRHRTYFTNNGFDAEAILNDDTDELLRLSVWSWQKFEEYINRHNSPSRVATMFPDHGTPTETENDEDGVVNQHENDGENVITAGENKSLVLSHRAPTSVLPVMSLMKPENEDGEEDEDKPPLLTIRSESARVCNTCFLAEKCPGYMPDSNCVYNIPITVRTREQFRALNQGMLEMQSQRVMFMRFAEEAEGGYADPNLSKEIGLLNKMMAAYSEMEKEGFNVNIGISGRGDQGAAAGVMSRLFGDRQAQQMQALEAPIQADEYIDIEVLGEGN